MFVDRRAGASEYSLPKYCFGTCTRIATREWHVMNPSTWSTTTVGRSAPIPTPTSRNVVTPFVPAASVIPVTFPSTRSQPMRSLCDRSSPKLVQPLKHSPPNRKQPMRSPSNPRRSTPPSLASSSLRSTQNWENNPLTI